MDIDPAKPHAFLSYTRFDDKFLNGGISALREALEQAVQARTGKPFNIFQDVDDIKPGDAWQKKLDRAIQAAQLFIPILTPSFFESDFCRGEAQGFLDYEARAGRDDLVLPIYLIDTPKLDDANQRAADEIASRLHGRQYDDWRPLRFKLQHDDTRPRIDELAGAIAHAVAKNGQAATPPPEQRPSEDIMDRLAGLEERDRAIASERSRRERAESALADEKARARELAEAPSAFEGQVEEAGKRETALRDELDRLKEKLTARDSASAKAALEENSKHEKIERQAPGIRRSFYLASAALALLFGAGGWMAGLGGSSSADIELLRRQNRELIEQRDAQKADLDKAQNAVADLRATVTAAQASGDKVSELSEQVEVLSARLAESEQTAAAKESELQEMRQALAEAKKKTLTAGETFKDCSDCPEMVVIPAGSFKMGSPDDEGGRDDDEGPQRGVPISRFALGRYEVTRSQFTRFVEETGHETGRCAYWDVEADESRWSNDRHWRNPGYHQTKDHPVACVSWEDVQAYVGWLSKTTGEQYRLPSEAEWEFAARAHTTTRYFWGDDVDSGCAFANSNDVTSGRLNKFTWKSLSCDDGFAQTAPVGEFDANGFDLHDTTGNVWEWVEDRWHDSYEGAPTDDSPWLEGSNSARVLRGGSWLDAGGLLRSAHRLSSGPGYRGNNVGFRVARTLTP